MTSMLTSVLPPWHWPTFFTGILFGLAISVAFRMMDSIFAKKSIFYVINLAKGTLAYTFDSRRGAERYAEGTAAVTKDNHAVAEGIIWFDGQPPWPKPGDVDKCNLNIDDQDERA